MLDPVHDMLPVFVGTLVPDEYDRTTVANRKVDIISRLEGHGLEVVNSFEAGSFSHGTGIKDHADIDLMAWITFTQKPQLASSALSRLRDALTVLPVRSVAVSSPAVQITFWSPPNFDVVPAYYNKDSGGITIYDIPGRADDWVNSAPKAHNAFVNEQNDRLNKKLKPLIRLAKAWKYNSGAPISSFYLEMRVTEYASGEKSIIYYIDLPRVLRAIMAKDLADMNDPQRIAGRIPACASEDKRRTAKKLLESAITNLEAADRARQSGDQFTYWISMCSVLGTNFPWPSKS